VAEPNHVLERRASLLAQKMQRRVQVLKEFMAPEGARPPFTQQLQRPQALRWWQEHRYDHLGAQVLQAMRPQDIAELDLALIEMNEQGQAMA
jgi:hypothetical protein